MKNKFWLSVVAVFVVLSVMDFLINGVLMRADYMATAQLWRPEGEMMIWLFYVVDLFIAYFFTLIFTKGYENKGMMEGVRYGFYVGMLMAVPMAYGTYGAMPIPYSLALKWFLFGLAQYIILGIVVASVYGKKAASTAAAA